MKGNLLRSLSVALNVLLLATVVWLFGERGRPPAPADSARGIQTVTNIIEVPVETPVPVPAQAFDWRLVESQDYRKYIANLRAIGCPEETIRDIIIADVNKLFEERLKEELGPPPKFEFWRTGNPLAMFAENRIEQQMTLNQEKRALLKELLGSSYEDRFDMGALVGAFNPFDTMLDFLPPATRTQLMELEQEFGLRMVKEMGGGTRDAEDGRRILEMMAEKDAAVAALLTPQEKEDYDLRMSQTAMMMRMQLDGFEPTEAEFRGMFQLQKEFDDQYSLLFPSMDEEDRERRAAAQTQLKEEMKALLGEQRFIEYERETDQAFKTLARITERQGLPKTAAVEVFEIQKLANSQVQQINTTLPPEQRQEVLRAIQEETRAAIQTLLGEEGVNALQKNPMTSRWVRQDFPRPD